MSWIPPIFSWGFWTSLLSANCRSFSRDVFATMLKDKKQRKSGHFVESRHSSENWTHFLWNNNLFCFIELIYPLVTWVKTIHCRNPPNHLIYILYHTHLFLKVMIVIAYFVKLVLILISMDFPPNVSDIVNNNHYNNLSSYDIIKTSHGNQVTVIDICLDVLHFNSSTWAFFLTEKNSICQGYSVAILILL